jgi:hypothetical protein
MSNDTFGLEPWQIYMMESMKPKPPSMGAYAALYEQDEDLYGPGRDDDE